MVVYIWAAGAAGTLSAWPCLTQIMMAQVEFNNQTLDKRCMSTVQLLLDIETLAHADYMTGTLNSGIPYLIEVRTHLLSWGPPSARPFS